MIALAKVLLNIADVFSLTLLTLGSNAEQYFSKGQFLAHTRKRYHTLVKHIPEAQFFKVDAHTYMRANEKAV